MVAALIHSTLLSDSGSDSSENKKHYYNLVKKIKKELGEVNNVSVGFMRQVIVKVFFSNDFKIIVVNYLC